MHIATKSSKIDITLEKDTKSISQKISGYLSRGDIVFLYGEIGVGKTTFIKYLINFLQTNNNQSITEVPSPTFNLVNEYYLESLTIKHYDLYRIYDEKELNSLGIFEDICKHITLIEWPEIIKNYKINNILDLYFEYDQDYNKRFLTISSNSKISFLDEFQ